MKTITPNELIADEYQNDSLEIVERNEDVDAMWGIDCVKLTSEHIKALQDGKCLYFEDGEYATVLYYEGEA